MFKTMSFYSLPEGADGVKIWKYHTEVHALDVKKVAGPLLKKYVIRRVIKAIRGEPTFWGIIEIWWESAEAQEEFIKRAQNYKGTASGKTPPEDFASLGIIRGFSVQIEDKEIV